jgi:hypothetical protein
MLLLLRELNQIYSQMLKKQEGLAINFMYHFKGVSNIASVAKLSTPAK